MEFALVIEWLKNFVCQNPLWSVIVSIFTPTALIQLRKYYLDYFSSLHIEFERISLSTRNNRRIAQTNEAYFTVGIKFYNKTRKAVHLIPVECRIITDSVTTPWHQCDWTKRKFTVHDYRPISTEISFFEANNFNFYQFEIMLKEEGGNKAWTKKSIKYIIKDSQIVELKKMSLRSGGV